MLIKSAQSAEVSTTSTISPVSSLCQHSAGGNVKIVDEKVIMVAKSKVGSKDNLAHKPAGGDKKVFSSKTDLSGVQSKVGSNPPLAASLEKMQID